MRSWLLYELTCIRAEEGDGLIIHSVRMALIPSLQSAHPVLPKLVPFVAVATANCINIPLMRQRELVQGVTVMDKEGNALGESRVCVCMYESPVNTG